jgi:class 3 adenylate cyclase
LLAEQTAADVIDGERKSVSALFADIKGSMELMEDLDPEDARAIAIPHVLLGRVAKVLVRLSEIKVLRAIFGLRNS